MNAASRGGYLLLILGLPLLSAGCNGDPHQRQAVSGTVTFKGQPLKTGSIEFSPSDGQATGVSVTITNGEYKLEKNQGLSPGNYKVKINAPDKDNLDVRGPQEDRGSPPKEKIPPRYNERTTLGAVVKKGEPNVFPFDLK